jgi:hypothetical protein
MITKSLGVDPMTGLETIHHYDELTKVTHIEYKQDVQPLLDLNKQLRSTDHQKNGMKSSWMHAARIPAIIQMKWAKEHGIKDIYSKEYWPKIRQLLNTDYKYLKVGDAKL